jgi:hypothetical protein
MYYVMLKCLISHVLLYADISLKAGYYLCSLIRHTFNLYMQEIFYSKEFRKNMCLFHFTISVSVIISRSLGSTMIVLEY